MSHLEIIYVDPGGSGYAPVQYMAHLAAIILDAQLTILQPRHFALSEKLAGLLPRTRGRISGLLICPRPTDLTSIHDIKNWRSKYDCLAAWVFDSFWTNRIPRLVRPLRIFDYVFVTEKEDLGTWSDVMRAPVEWLPWGADVLRLGSASSDRPIDILRFGRQPPEWDDDIATAQACERLNLRFQMRPPFLTEAVEAERCLMGYLARAKFTLSFSNKVNPSVQTHPTREYITARWTDALAAGATVAGVPPKSESASLLLWHEALLDLQTTKISEGLELLARAVSKWTPDRSAVNHLHALERLDWRWRFQRLGNVLGLHLASLEAELDLLRNAINSQKSTSAKSK